MQEMVELSKGQSISTATELQVFLLFSMFKACIYVNVYSLSGGVL